MIKREKNNKSEVKILATLEGQKWKDAQKNAFNELYKNFEHKGFRKGKVPMDIAKKSIDQNSIWNKSIEFVIKDIAKEAAALIKKDEVVIAGPFYRIASVTVQKLELSLVYTLYPKINIGNYKNLKIKYDIANVTNDEVATEIKKIQDRLSIWNIVDSSVKKDMKVKFDFEGFVDKKPFEGGKAKNYELIIGSNKFVPGFEDGMIGMKVDEKRDIKITFPKNYHDAKLSGKPAVFKVKLHSVMKKSVPEQNDTLAIEANVPGVHSLNDLKKYLKNIILETKTINNKIKFKEEAFKKIMETTKFEMPDVLLEQQLQKNVKEFDQNLKRQNLDIQKFSKMSNTTTKEIVERLKDDSKKQLIDSFVFAEISKLENISVSEKEYEKKYEKIAKIYNQPIEMIKTKIPKVNLQVQMMNEKVIDFIINNRSK